MDVKLWLKKTEKLIVRIAFIQLIFLIIAQISLYKKPLAIYLNKTIYAEGVFFELIVKTMEILDHLA